MHHAQDRETSVPPGRINLARIAIYTVATAVVAIGILAWLRKQTDGASSPSVASIPPTISGPYDPSEYTIRIETTPCFGICPVYDMTIDGQGNVQLETEGVIRKEGETDNPKFVDIITSYHIGKERHLALIETLEQGGFSRLDPDYSRLVTDNPSVTISVASSLGSWSTHVYAVACVRDAEGLRHSSDDRKFVPNVFCDLRDQLHAIACEAHSNGTTNKHDDDIEEFLPPRCDPRHE